MQATTPYAGHVVEVRFQSHYNAHDMFSNTTWLLPAFSMVGKIMLYSKYFYWPISHGSQGISAEKKVSHETTRLGPRGMTVKVPKQAN